MSGSRASQQFNGLYEWLKSFISNPVTMKQQNMDVRAELKLSKTTIPMEIDEALGRDAKKGEHSLPDLRHVSTSSSSSTSLMKKWKISELDKALHDAVYPEDKAGLPRLQDLKREGFGPNNIDLGSELDELFNENYTPPSTRMYVLNPPTGSGYTPREVYEYTAPMNGDRAILTQFQALEQRAKFLSTDVSSKLHKPAALLIQVLNYFGHLPVCSDLEEFSKDPESYAQKRYLRENRIGKLVTRSFLAKIIPGFKPSETSTSIEAIAPPKALDTDIKQLVTNSQDILRRAMTWVQWVSSLENDNKVKDFKTSDRILGLLKQDQEWMKDSEVFLKDLERQTSSIINYNPKAPEQLIKLTGGVQFPHSPLVHRSLESTGFIYSPTTFKRDRCVCQYCGIKVSGWRPWHNAWQMHDWSQQHPVVPPPGTGNVPLDLPLNRGTIEEYIPFIQRVFARTAMDPQAEVKRLTSFPYLEHLPDLLKAIYELRKLRDPDVDLLVGRGNYNLLLENFSYANQIASALYQLNQQNLLSQETYEMVIRYPSNALEIDGFSIVGIAQLINKGLATQANLDKFMRCPQALTKTLIEIPSSELTQRRFDEEFIRLNATQSIAPLLSFMRAHLLQNGSKKRKHGENNTRTPHPLSTSIITIISNGLFSNLTGMTKQTTRPTSTSTSTSISPMVF